MEDQAAFVRFIYTTGKRIFKEPSRLFAFRKRTFVNALSTFVWALVQTQLHQNCSSSSALPVPLFFNLTSQFGFFVLTYTKWSALSRETQSSADKIHRLLHCYHIVLHFILLHCYHIVLQFILLHCHHIVLHFSLDLFQGDCAGHHQTCQPCTSNPVKRQWGHHSVLTCFPCCPSILSVVVQVEELLALAVIGMATEIVDKIHKEPRCDL